MKLAILDAIVNSSRKLCETILGQGIYDSYLSDDTESSAVKFTRYFTGGRGPPNLREPELGPVSDLFQGRAMIPTSLNASA